MIPISRHSYQFTTSKNIIEIIDVLQAHTLKRNARSSIGRTITNKNFIGNIGENSFSIIDSSPAGVLCKLEGTISNDGHQSTIEITTSIQRIFINLFSFWCVFVGLMFLSTFFMRDTGFGAGLSFFIITAIAILVFRWALHGVYIIARDNAIQKITLLIG